MHQRGVGFAIEEMEVGGAARCVHSGRVTTRVVRVHVVVGETVEEDHRQLWVEVLDGVHRLVAIRYLFRCAAEDLLDDAAVAVVHGVTHVEGPEIDTTRDGTNAGGREPLRRPRVGVGCRPQTANWAPALWPMTSSSSMLSCGWDSAIVYIVQCARHVVEGRRPTPTCADSSVLDVVDGQSS